VLRKRARACVRAQRLVHGAPYPVLLPLLPHYHPFDLLLVSVIRFTDFREKNRPLLLVRGGGIEIQRLARGEPLRIYIKLLTRDETDLARGEELRFLSRSPSRGCCG